MSSRVKVYSATRKPVCGFLFDLHYVQHCVSDRILHQWLSPILDILGGGVV